MENKKSLNLEKLLEALKAIAEVVIKFVELVFGLIAIKKAVRA